LFLSTFLLSFSRLCNSLSRDFFSKFPNAITTIDQNLDVNVVVILSSVGAHFCSCIDLTTLGSISNKSLSRSDRGRAEEKLRQEIKFL
jgi:delta(3,5)-delta(2,4)-dienoyl-CoA isomerase